MIVVMMTKYEEDHHHHRSKEQTRSFIYFLLRLPTSYFLLLSSTPPPFSHPLPIPLPNRVIRTVCPTHRQQGLCSALDKLDKPGASFGASRPSRVVGLDDPIAPLVHFLPPIPSFISPTAPRPKKKKRKEKKRKRSGCLNQDNGVVKFGESLQE